jgi:hypothetical protein
MSGSGEVADPDRDVLLFFGELKHAAHSDCCLVIYSIYIERCWRRCLAIEVLQNTTCRIW